MKDKKNSAATRSASAWGPATVPTKKTSGGRRSVRAAPRGSVAWLDVYTDGSHFKHQKSKSTPAIGYGIWCKHEDQEYGLAQRVDPTHLETFFKMPREMSRAKVSNPTMELCAAVHTLMLISRMPRVYGAPKPKTSRVVRIFCDCDGVREWIGGRWQAKQPYIKHLVTMAHNHLDRINERGIFVQFVRVDGHSGDAGNDAADALSKGQWKEGMPDISKLFT